MVKISSGLLMYKIKDGKLLFFLVHPGGPFWKNKDEGAWGIPKGEINDSEGESDAAKREFEEETGIKSKEPYIPLGKITQKSGKIVHAWAFQGDWTGLLMGNSFVNLEYPAHSGKMIKFPEVDKAGFFTLEKSKELINPAQYDLLLRLKEHLKL